MDKQNIDNAGGSLQISSGVVEKVAKQAALEVDGVSEVRGPSSPTKNIIGAFTAAGPIRVEIIDGVADIEISIVSKYGSKIPEVAEKVQKNVKTSVQNMTSITVGRVDVVVTGVDTSGAGA